MLQVLSQGKIQQKQTDVSPRVHAHDSGLVHALLGIMSLEQVAWHPVLGESREGYVIATQTSVPPPRSTSVFLPNERRDRSRPRNRAWRRHALGDRDQALAVRRGRVRLPRGLRRSKADA